MNMETTWNEFRFEETTREGLEPFITRYLAALSGVTDDFWEEHILNASFYGIRERGIVIGGFAVYGGTTLTLFYLPPERIVLAQPIFAELLKRCRIQNALTATCDELLLSLCLDYHESVGMQAYFFNESTMKSVSQAEYPRESLEKIQPGEIDEVNRELDGFFHDVTQAQLKAGVTSIYRLLENGEALGYGVIVRQILRAEYASCGMITRPSFRRKGVGRSIQLHLADICREEGRIPVAGCWYGNSLSKRTLESAGRFSQTRLLNISFPRIVTAQQGV